MINHEHKCIFIHISKCAGTSIENAFGLLNQRVNIADYKNLYGWCDKNKIFLQHATPQELLDFGYIDKNVWDDYYKFIIIRNPWDRMYSDYVWMLKQIPGFGTFKEFITKKGKFEKRLTQKNKYYRGDHLNKQYDYFVLNGNKIKYDKVLNFENLGIQLKELAMDLGLDEYIFNEKMKVSSKKFKHYSIFYNKRKLQLLEANFDDDVKNLHYSFDKKFKYSFLKNSLFLFFHFNFKKAIKKYFFSNSLK